MAQLTSMNFGACQDMFSPFASGLCPFRPLQVPSRPGRARNKRRLSERRLGEKPGRLSAAPASPATAPPPGFFASVVVAQIELVSTTEPRFSCRW
ncbi:hypothetical protein [Sinorhizobium fredii]|nr:hypothetical protein [Sinorhizobium fredii]